MSDGNVGLVVYTPPKEPLLISKRCMRCGIQYGPNEMVNKWGYNWQDKTMCKACREAQTSPLVIMVPKLKGKPAGDIQSWWIPQHLREFGAKTYRDIPVQTKLFISDGDRFWNWTQISYRMSDVTSFDDFIKACPDWKIIHPEEGVYPPDASSYIAH